MQTECGGDAYIRTRTQTRTHTYRRTHTHTHIHAHTHTHASHTYMHAHAHTHIICECVCAHSQTIDSQHPSVRPSIVIRCTCPRRFACSDMVKSIKMYFKGVSETLTPFKFNRDTGYTKAASRHAVLLSRLTVLNKLRFEVGELKCVLRESCRPGEWQIFVAIFMAPTGSILARYVHPDEHHITICHLYDTDYGRLCALLPLVTHVCGCESWRFREMAVGFPRASTGVTGTCTLYPAARLSSCCAAVASELRSRFDARVSCFRIPTHHMQLHPATYLSGRTQANRCISQRQYFALVSAVYTKWPELNPYLNPW